MSGKQHESSKQNLSPIRYSAAYVLRLRHGMTQKQVADLANITQADISEMENYAPYGRLAKYIRLAKVYNTPVETLVKNDLRTIPPDALKLPELEYTSAPDSPGGLLGRQGEEFALQITGIIIVQIDAIGLMKQIANSFLQ